MKNYKIINLVIFLLIILSLLNISPVSAHEDSLSNSHYPTNSLGVGNSSDLLDITAVGPLVFDSFLVDDDNFGNSVGNDSGTVECGETIELYVDLLNSGTDLAATVNATISTIDPYVTFIFNTVSIYPDIPGSGTATNTNDYDMVIDSNTPDGHIVTFDLSITAAAGGPWLDTFTMPVACGPRIQVSQASFDFVVPPGGSDWDTLVIDNNGFSELNLDIFVGTDPKVIDDWVVYYDWDCNGSPGSAVITFSADHTFTDSQGGSGTWNLNNSEIVWIYSPSGTQYTGLIAGNYMAGTMVATGLSGCWDAERTLIVPVTLINAENTLSGELSNSPGISSNYLPTKDYLEEIVVTKPEHVASVYTGFDSTIDSQSADSAHVDLSSTLEAAAGGTVLWDLTHGIYLGYEPTNNYSSLVSFLNSEGFSIYTTSFGVDNINLAVFDILVVNLGSAWSSIYTPSEVAAISNFVNAGGGLVVMGDDAGNPNGNINPVAQAFGSTSGVSSLSPNDLYISNFAVHPIFDGVSEIYNRAAGELTASNPSSIAAWEPGGHGVVSVAEVGAGGVVIIGDINLWDNTHISISQNQLFAENVFNWLSNPWLSADPILGTIPAGGSTNVKVSVDATDKSPGLYHGGLAIKSDDPRPDKDLIIVSVTMRVNVPPNKPLNPTPADGSVGVPNTAILGWTGGDLDPDDKVTYDVYFDTYNPPVNLICDDTDIPVCDPGTLSEVTPYYWKVVTEDDLGVTSSGVVWQFQTGGNIFMPISLR